MKLHIRDMGLELLRECQEKSNIHRSRCQGNTVDVAFQSNVAITAKKCKIKIKNILFRAFQKKNFPSGILNKSQLSTESPLLWFSVPTPCRFTANLLSSLFIIHLSVLPPSSLSFLDLSAPLYTDVLLLAPLRWVWKQDESMWKEENH